MLLEGAHMIVQLASFVFIYPVRITSFTYQG